MATECPECESVFNGKSCACGYSPPPTREVYKHKDYGERKPPPEEFKKAAKKCFAQPGREWAHHIIDLYEKGLYKYEHVYRDYACVVANHLPDMNHEESF